MHSITVIPGDGIGPEVVSAMQQVIDASGIQVDWAIHNAGESVLAEKGSYLPQDVLDSFAETKIGIKGPITTPFGKGFKSVNLALRRSLKTYAIVRPVRSIPHVSLRYPQVDLVTIRESTEELYAGVEHYIDDTQTSAETIAIVTERASKRIARFAFEYAKKNNRKKITVVHKANVMKLTMGLFRDIGLTMGHEYPQIQVDERVVDNMAQQLVMHPERYDMLLTTNLFGDILSDLAAGLIGGLGLSPGANFGDEYALFEPVHGSAPKYAGKNIANPTATILTGVMMLKHLGETKTAEMIEKATYHVLSEGSQVTQDIAQLRNVQSIGTREMADQIIAAFETVE